MHIVVDARKAQDSGIGTYIRHVVPGVIQRLPEHQFTVLTRTEDKALFEPYGRPGVRTLPVTDAPFSLGEQWSLRRLLAGEPRPDAFWATSLAHPVATRVPIVATIHDVVQLTLRGTEGSKPIVRNVVRLLALSLHARAKLLLFNSHATRAEFKRHFGTSAAVEVVAHLGVSTDWFNGGTSRPAHTPYLICVTSWRTHKNLPLLLRAFQTTANRIPHDLVVVGANPLEAPEPIPDLGKRVRWLGRVPDDMLRTLVSNAEAMIIPSLHEGFGLPALEALASGCPLLVSEIEAFIEVCGDAARYFDPRRPSSIVDAILSQLSLSAAAVSGMRSRGISRAASFTWDQTAEHTALALNNLQR